MMLRRIVEVPPVRNTAAPALARLAASVDCTVIACPWFDLLSAPPEATVIPAITTSVNSAKLSLMKTPPPWRNDALPRIRDCCMRKPLPCITQTPPPDSSPSLSWIVQSIASTLDWNSVNPAADRNRPRERLSRIVQRVIVAELTPLNAIPDVPAVETFPSTTQSVSVYGPPYIQMPAKTPPEPLPRPMTRT